MHGPHTSNLIRSPDAFKHISIGEHHSSRAIFFILFPLALKANLTAYKDTIAMPLVIVPLAFIAFAIGKQK